MVDTYFHPKMWNNSFGLEKVLKGESAFKEIEDKSKNPKFLEQKISRSLSGLRVLWITTKVPFQTVVSIFFNALAYLTAALQLTKMSRILSVVSMQMLRDWEQLCDQWAIQSKNLAPSFNAHQFTSWDAYSQDPYSVASIEDEQVFKLTSHRGAFIRGIQSAMQLFHKNLERTREGQNFFYQFWRGQKLSSEEKMDNVDNFIQDYSQSPEKAFENLRAQYSNERVDQPLHQLYTDLKKLDQSIAENHGKIHLFSENGLGKGASIWFINLYMKTLHLFKDPEKHLIAIAEQFRTGVPRQGTLLQALDRTEDMLQLKSRIKPNHQIFSFELDHDHKSAKEKIMTLATGIYRVEVCQHSLVYLKLSDTEEYVWNPSFGLFKMNGNEMLNMILKYHYQPRNLDLKLNFYKFKCDFQKPKGAD